MRKAQDDVVARTAVENMIGDLFAANGHSIGDRDADVAAARALVGTFKAVEFERVVKTVGDDQVALRRPLLTGAWEVDPDGKAEQGK